MGGYDDGGQNFTRLPRRNNADAHQRQVEGAYYPGSAAGNKTVWGIEKIHRQRKPKGTDLPASANGGKRPADQDGLSRGSAAGGVHFNGARPEFEAGFGCNVELG